MVIRLCFSFLEIFMRLLPVRYTVNQNGKEKEKEKEIEKKCWCGTSSYIHVLLPHDTLITHHGWRLIAIPSLADRYNRGAQNCVRVQDVCTSHLRSEIYEITPVLAQTHKRTNTVARASGASRPRRPGGASRSLYKLLFHSCFFFFTKTRE